MPNYKDWIDAVDIKVDYFSAFLKAWIAFNSWYDSGEIDGRTDKEKIDNISSRDNRFRRYMSNLLIEKTADGVSYRDNVAMLHSSLLGAAITTQEFIGVRQAVSFSEVAVKNQNAQKAIDFYAFHYECSRVRGIIKTIVSYKDTGTALFSFEQDEHNEDVLKQQTAFIALTETQKGKCLECYTELRPYIIESVLDSSDTALKLGAYNFVNDTSKISRAIIMILYSLRCALAHGDISPDVQSNNVYHYAYEVLVPPLKRLR